MENQAFDYGDTGTRVTTSRNPTSPHSSSGITRTFNQCEPIDYEQKLRTRILAHCRELYAIDRTYANWAFDNYARMVPWLGLERKQ